MGKTYAEDSSRETMDYGAFELRNYGPAEVRRASRSKFRISVLWPKK